MGGGLGSGLARLKPEQDRVLLSQNIEETEGGDLKQTGFDLNDEPLVSSLDEVEIEEKEEIEECREDGELGDQKVGELNENGMKRGKVEDSEDNKEDNSVKEKVMKESFEGKEQFPTRVLRSKFAVKNGSEKEDDISGDCYGSEKKLVESVKEEDDQSDDEGKGKPERMPEVKCSDEDERKEDSVNKGQSNHSDGVNVGNIRKRKRGRPPKNQGNNGYEEMAVELQTGEHDHSDGVARKGPKRKPGRPPKNQGNNGYEEMAVELQTGEHDHSDGVARKGPKRKPGRPPKVPRNGGFEKKAVKMESGQSDHFDCGINNQPKRKPGRPPKGQGNCGFEKTAVMMEAGESDLTLGEGSMESKHKRGRPSNSERNHERPPGLPSKDGFEQAVKVVIGEGDHFDCELSKEMKPKCGRPPKVQGSDGLGKKREGSHHNNTNTKGRKGAIGRRGRPPKLQFCNEALKGKLINGRKKLGGLNRGRKKLSGTLKFNVPANTSYSEKRLIGKESNSKGLVSAIKGRYECMENNDGKSSLMLRSKAVNVKSKQKRAAANSRRSDEGEQKRSEAKQAVRDRIVKLLLDAGWTIEYRPRSTKEYNDAVYVNPEGKTHWSVTLAYRVLKAYYESDDGASKVSSNGFIFTPIPEEELSMLKRVTMKQRRGKKNAIDEYDDIMDDGGVEKKMNKGKKKRKGYGDNEGVKKRKKQKLPNEEDNSDGTFQKGTQASGRKRKLQQTQKGKRYALLVRNSMEGAGSENDGYVLYDGKRTVLSWMIDLGSVPQDGKVEYMIQRRTRATRDGKSGRITRDGIQCNCCSDVFTVAEFETHAGSRLRRPFENICLETGTPLLQCLLDAWKKQQSKYKGFHYVDFSGEDPNDDTCGICGDGGNLICCDSCPSTFHQSCLDIKAFPSGNWHCVYCTCKYCGMVKSTFQRDNDADIDPAVLTCRLCEEKYHQHCTQTMDAIDDDSNSASFCGKKCKELFERLQMLVGVKHELPEGFSWTLVHRFDIDPDVRLSEAYQKIESNSKLAVALAVMDECFLPLVDHRSGINLIHNIVYNFGSNFTRLNYSGFFTAILERGDEITCAASIRIHGNQLAEMPYIGTRYAHRRQGMCRRLLSAVESALRSLNVEKLVIPAISDLRETWTSVFGFQPLETASKQKMRNMNLLVFPGVDMLQKPLLMHVKEDRMMNAESNKSGPVVFDLNVSAESPVPQTDERSSAPPAVESTLLLPDGTLKDTSDLMVETVNLPESAAGSSSCILASGEQKLGFDPQLSTASEVKIDESIAKQSLDRKHEGSVKQSNDIVPAGNEVAVLVHVSKVDSQNVVTDSSDRTFQMSEDAKDIKHQENKLQAVECFSDFDKMVQTEDLEDNHAIAKDAANQTSASAVPSVQDVENSIYDVSSYDGNSRPCQSDRICASKEVSAPPYVNSHPCDDTSKKENLQLCPGMYPEVVSGGSEVDFSGIHDLKETTTIHSDFSDGDIVTNMADKNTKSPEHPVSIPQSDPSHPAPNHSESFCNSNSSSTVALHCASAGGESRGPEVIVLSNQAS
ncbi:Zinc finger, PHD-type [Corchorus olitorius]|uniref:Zinc finger, PHD-type n=1 Tax=Corchorus olitorius TaxID=93759 RepID=A0A1R3KDC7_9ROSI|nr:Zinc finger, PHD-type [Corchorus olitorius]